MSTQQYINELQKQYHNAYKTATREELERMSQEIKQARKEHQDQLLKGFNQTGIKDVVIIEKRPGIWQVGGTDPEGNQIRVTSPDLSAAQERWNNQEYDN